MCDVRRGQISLMDKILLTEFYQFDQLIDDNFNHKLQVLLRYEIHKARTIHIYN